MKILKILLVLIFSLFVTDNLPQDAEASGKSYISGSNVGQKNKQPLVTPLEQAKASLKKSIKNLVNNTTVGEDEHINTLVNLFVDEANLAKNNKCTAAMILQEANEIFIAPAFREYSGKEESVPHYLQLLTTITRAWFQTQYNPHVNTLSVEAVKEGGGILMGEAIGTDKIFLFISGQNALTGNDSLDGLQKVINECNTLMPSGKTVEVIDIHKLLGIEVPLDIRASSLKRFMYFSSNFYKSKRDPNYQRFLSYTGVDKLGRPNFINIEKAIEEIYKNGTSTQFNKYGSFKTSTANKDFKKLMEELLKILSFCEISGNLGVVAGGDIKDEFVKLRQNIIKYRDSIIKFLSGKITAKILIDKLFSSKNNEYFPDDIRELLHTEKILVTSLKCLEIPEEIRRDLITIKDNRGKMAHLVLPNLFHKLLNKRSTGGLCEIEKFIFGRLAELLNNVDRRYSSSYEAYFENDIRIILNIAEKLEFIKNKSLNITSDKKICDFCDSYIKLIIKDNEKDSSGHSIEHSVFHRM